MADNRTVNFRILRRGGTVTTYQASLDPDDAGAVKEELHDWLRKSGWHEGLWGSFSAEVRLPGSGRVVARVRG